MVIAGLDSYGGRAEEFGGALDFEPGSDGGTVARVTLSVYRMAATSAAMEPA